MVRRIPLESAIEKAVSNAIVKRGGVIDKTISLSRRGYFDRVAVLAGRVFFIETKRPRGGIISPHQKALHREYLSAGASVIVIRSEQELAAWLSTLDG